MTPKVPRSSWQLKERSPVYWSRN